MGVLIYTSKQSITYHIVWMNVKFYVVTKESNLSEDNNFTKQVIKLPNLFNATTESDLII